VQFEAKTCILSDSYQVWMNGWQAYGICGVADWCSQCFRNCTLRAVCDPRDATGIANI